MDKVIKELGWVASTEELRVGGLLAVANESVNLFLCIGFESLPGQRTPQEIHEHEAKTLHVVSTALLDARMRIDRGIPRRAREILPLQVRNMTAGARVLELLRQAEVNHVADVHLRAHADEEVVRLDVAVDVRARVHELEARDHLVGEHEHRLERQSFAAVVEEIFERRTEKINDEHIVISLRTKPFDARNSESALQ